MDPIRTERLRLRRFDTGDADNLLALHNDPLVMRWINGGEATPRTVIEGRTLPAFIADNQEHTWGGFHTAEDPVTGSFLGWFSLSRPDADETQCSLGYRLARSAWGRGLELRLTRRVLEGEVALNHRHEVDLHPPTLRHFREPDDA